MLFLDMGFDALFSDLVKNLQEHKENLKEKVQILMLQFDIQYDPLLLDFVYPDVLPSDYTLLRLGDLRL